LVVDDYPDSGELICALLTTLGHETRFADSGRAALAEAHAFDPDVVILDLGLPDMDGCDVARALRRLRLLGPLHIVALTGWNHSDRRRLALAAGCDQFVLKPCSGAKLKAILREIDRPA